MAPEVAAWVRHYSSGFFTNAHLRSRLEEVEALRPHQRHEKDFADRYAIAAALRHLLSKPGTQTKLF